MAVMIGRFAVSDLPENTQANDAKVPVSSHREHPETMTPPVTSQEIHPELIERSSITNPPEQFHHLDIDRRESPNTRNDYDSIHLHVFQIFQESLSDKVPFT